MSYRLSPNFLLSEMTFTQVRGEDNTPSLTEVENLKFLCAHLLEPIRKKWGPLIVTSGYRSIAVNLAVGGSPTSAHIKGCAADVILEWAVHWADIIEWLMAKEQAHLPLDQVIYESPKTRQPWLHIGTRPNGLNCRKQALACFELGKFEPWNPKDPRLTR